LKSGAFAVPASELAAAQQELAQQAIRKALQAEEAKKFNTLYQNQVAEQRAGAVKLVATDHALASSLKGDLVGAGNSALGPVEDERLAKKKLIALYFSALWCGPCRKFTPELVQFYNRVAPAHPEFEIVFVSRDRSPFSMATYMRDMKMPWPAVKFDKVPEKEQLLKYAGPGIPCLVLIDAEGRVISHTYEGTQYLGPGKVLADLDKMWGAPPAPVALQR
jgi:nucleoredoxin